MRRLFELLLISMLCAGSGCAKAPTAAPLPAPSGVVTLCIPVSEELPPDHGEHSPVCGRSLRVSVAVTESGLAEGTRTLDEKTGKWLSAEEHPTYHAVMWIVPEDRARVRDFLASRVNQGVVVVAGATVISNLYVMEADVTRLELIRDSSQEVERILALVKAEAG
jgi:hypothetical protein